MEIYSVKSFVGRTSRGPFAFVGMAIWACKQATETAPSLLPQDIVFNVVESALVPQLML